MSFAIIEYSFQTYQTRQLTNLIYIIMKEALLVDSLVDSDVEVCHRHVPEYLFITPLTGLG